METILNTALEIAAEEKYGDILNFLLNQGANDIYRAVSEAVNAGDMPTADRLIGLYNVDRLIAKLGGAAEAGNLSLVQELIAQGANDLSDALELASRGHRIEVIKILINQGADSFEESLQLGMRNIEVVKLLLEYIPHIHRFNLMEEAILTGKPEIFELVYTKFRGNKHFVLNTIAREGWLELVEKFFQLNPDYTDGLDLIIDTATERGNIITCLLLI